MATLRLAALSDPHLPAPWTPPGTWHNRLEFETAAPRLRRALSLAAAEQVDAIVLLGDAADAGDRDALDRAVAMVAEAGPEAWLVPGNHDTRGGAADALEQAVERLGAPHVRVPGAAGDDYRGLVLAGVLLDGEDGGYRARSLDPPLGANARPDELLVCLSHFPMISLSDELLAADFRYPGDLLERDELAEQLDQHEPAATIVLSGHLHLRHAGAYGTLLQISCGPLIEPPFEVTFVTIEHEGEDVALDVRCEAVAGSGSARLPILSPASSRWEFGAGTWTSTA